MRIQPARQLRGRVSNLPGDKSISHRAAIISALAFGQSRIANFSTSQDCTSTLQCLDQMGVTIKRKGSDLLVQGVGSESRENPLPWLRASTQALDCGNSGSTMRMLAGVLAGQPFSSTLTGDDSLRSRPMTRIIEPLERMGARLLSEQGRAPLHIEGRNPLASIRYEMPIASAQVKSAILLAGLCAEGRTEVIEKLGPTRDHTERMLRWFGVDVVTKTQGWSIPGDDVGESRNGIEGGGTPPHSVVVQGPAQLTARDVIVPGDISSAAFLLAAASLLPGSHLEIAGVGLNATRAHIVETLVALGADIRAVNIREQCHEIIGDIEVRGTDMLASSVGGNEPDILRGSIISGLIDELPILAVVGTQVKGGLRIGDAKELRVKESDRIRTTVENLQAMGADVEEYEDGLAVDGPVRLRGARLRAYGDHRIAMACAVAALIAEGESEIEGAECVGVSYPEFFQLLDSVTKR